MEIATREAILISVLLVRLVMPLAKVVSDQQISAQVVLQEVTCYLQLIPVLHVD